MSTLVWFFILCTFLGFGRKGYSIQLDVEWSKSNEIFSLFATILFLFCSLACFSNFSFGFVFIVSCQVFAMKTEHSLMQVAFKTGDFNQQVIFIGGLTDGLLATEYVTSSCKIYDVIMYVCALHSCLHMCVCVCYLFSHNPTLYTDVFCIVYLYWCLAVSEEILDVACLIACFSLFLVFFFFFFFYGCFRSSFG